MSLPFDPSGLGGLMQGLMGQMQAAQAEAESTEVVGMAGDGLVQVTCSGAMEITRVHIDPEVLDDAALVQDLVLVATNDALRQARALMEGAIGGMLGGLPPGLMPPGIMGR